MTEPDYTLWYIENKSPINLRSHAGDKGGKPVGADVGDVGNGELVKLDLAGAIPGDKYTWVPCVRMGIVPGDEHQFGYLAKELLQLEAVEPEKPPVVIPPIEPPVEPKKPPEPQAIEITIKITTGDPETVAAFLAAAKAALEREPS